MTLDLTLASLTLVGLFVFGIILADGIMELFDKMVRKKPKMFYIPRNDDPAVAQFGLFCGYGKLEGGRWSMERRPRHIFDFGLTYGGLESTHRIIKAKLKHMKDKGLRL